MSLARSTTPSGPKPLRCAIYTRKSTEHGLEQEFNSLDNQREAAEAYIKSQAHEGWRLQPELYDDGGFSGGSLERPALQRLLAEVRAGRIDVIVVYKALVQNCYPGLGQRHGGAYRATPSFSG